jgi:hypothetical protein
VGIDIPYQNIQPNERPGRRHSGVAAL